MAEYTLYDLRIARAAYEAEMAEVEEKRWAQRRAYHGNLRRFPVDDHGNLAAATLPVRREQHDPR